MSGQVLDLTIIVYGSSENDPNDDSRFSGYNQRRVELEFRPPVPKADMLGNVDRMMTWAKWSIIELLQDIKHSQKWHCEFCDKPARETVQFCASWVNRVPPKMIVYTHQVCKTKGGRCAKALDEISHMMPGTWILESPEVPSTAEGEIPLSASCANCQKTETARRGTLSTAGQRVKEKIGLVIKKSAGSSRM
ncbi:hypothetical protein NLI96_g7696 [Meripilus lineatus]|uniref:Uncharacterized protein n=1 Tax=Meripilus lineatus TaxID=2056292 RepID=A0AAD5V0I0_9APHY|nr:hypothetical protein NLI96_g7696 [Physisporinus lineatus]